MFQKSIPTAIHMNWRYCGTVYLKCNRGRRILIIGCTRHIGYSYKYLNIL